MLNQANLSKAIECFNQAYACGYRGPAGPPCPEGRALNNQGWIYLYPELQSMARPLASRKALRKEEFEELCGECVQEVAVKILEMQESGRLTLLGDGVEDGERTSAVAYAIGLSSSVSKSFPSFIEKVMRKHINKRRREGRFPVDPETGAERDISVDLRPSPEREAARRMEPLHVKATYTAWDIGLAGAHGGGKQQRRALTSARLFLRLRLFEDYDLDDVNGYKLRTYDRAIYWLSLQAGQDDWEDHAGQVLRSFDQFPTPPEPTQFPLFFPAQTQFRMDKQASQFFQLVQYGDQCKQHQEALYRVVKPGVIRRLETIRGGLPAETEQFDVFGIGNIAKEDDA